MQVLRGGLHEGLRRSGSRPQPGPARQPLCNSWRPSAHAVPAVPRPHLRLVLGGTCFCDILCCAAYAVIYYDVLRLMCVVLTFDPFWVVCVFVIQQSTGPWQVPAYAALCMLCCACCVSALYPIMGDSCHYKIRLIHLFHAEHTVPTMPPDSAYLLLCFLNLGRLPRLKLQPCCACCACCARYARCACCTGCACYALPSDSMRAG